MQDTTRLGYAKILYSYKFIMCHIYESLLKDIMNYNITLVTLRSYMFYNLNI